MIFSGATLAQDPAPDAVADGDGGLMDQVVPVAEENAASEETEVTGPPQAEIDPKTELLEQFELYKRLMVEGIYDEADSVAKRIVTLAIEITGPNSTETAKALTNLGIVQHRNQQFDAAQQNFETAIEIIEDNEDRLNDRLINPLKGLGAAQLEGGRPDLAARTFNRAIHITHVNDGPHNMGQIEMLESMAETNLRLGSIEDAREMHDKIYMLHQRRYEDDQLALIPSLMRRAEWQHDAGYITDEQATYRRAIRIIETNSDKTDLRLIEPLTKLGLSYFFSDLHEEQGVHRTAVTGEIYFKRALRIAESNPESNLAIAANAKLTLGNYYMMQGTHSRARRAYTEVWESLSENEEMLTLRDEMFGHIAPLNDRPIPEYAGGAKAQTMNTMDGEFQQGSVTVSFSITERGRVSDLKHIEVQPAEFTNMQKLVQRELRSRVYRPIYEAAEPVETTDHVFTHVFFFKQSDLDERREAQIGTADAESG
jgi:tetratricopeptide (TPR) repeat protein